MRLLKPIILHWYGLRGSQLMAKKRHCQQSGAFDVCSDMEFGGMTWPAWLNVQGERLTAQQLEHRLLAGIGLRQHSGSSLLHDLVLRQFGRSGRVICILDLAARGRQVH